MGIGINATYVFLFVIIFALSFFAVKPLSVNSVEPLNLTPQEVKIAVEGIDYVPNEIEIQVGRPVRLIVDGTNAISCVKYFSIPSFGINSELKSGENIFEFTPLKKGTIPFSCSMGMATGRFIVV